MRCLDDRSERSRVERRPRGRLGKRAGTADNRRMDPLLAAYVHGIDPIALSIRWYGLSYLLGFILGFLVILRVVRVGRSTLQPEVVANLGITFALSVMVGARLGYVLFYQPALLVEFDGVFPFWGALAVNRGGMSSHGGMIGVVVASGLYAWRQRHDWGHVLDLGALAAPLGLCFGRIANFINGELYGRECSPDFAWAVKFPQEVRTWSLEQLESPAMQQVLTIVAPAGVVAQRRYDQLCEQVIAAVQAGSREATEALAPLLTPRHPSQLYEAALEGLLLFAVLAVIALKPRRPFTLAGVFALVYAVFRIGVEEYRLPDHDLGFEWLGLTRGQWLSVGLLLAGLVALVISRWRKAEPMGGLLPVTDHPAAARR